MKNIVIIAIIISGVVFYLTGRDPFPKSVNFSGSEYTLGQDTGKKGTAKTYQYTKSGRINGINDYVQIIVVNKEFEHSQGVLGMVKKMLKASYNVESLPSSRGKFSIFKVSSEPREYYSYLITQETSSAHWFIQFVIQSNFANNRIKPEDAKNNAREYISSLKSVFDDVSL